MSNHPQKTIYLRFYLAYCFCALLVYAFLMAFVLPWWHAANHPVVVHLGAGSAQKIGLSFSQDEEPVILMPVGAAKGYHWKWATELPPRPDYELRLVFPEGTIGDVVFKQLELIQLKPSRKSSFLKIRDIPMQDRPGIQLNKLVDGIRISAEPGAVLDLEVTEAEPTTAYAWIKTWAQASLGYLVCALILLFTLASLLQFPDRVQAYRKWTPPWELVLTLLFAMVGAAIHLHLLNHAMPAFTPGESDQHVEFAIRMHDGLELANMPPTALPDRPGYATLISRIAGHADWDLHAVVLAQGLLYCTGLALLGLAMNRLVSAWIIGPVLVFACISPAAIWTSRHIGAESLGISSTLFCLCAFLYVWQTEKIIKWLAFVLFAMAVVVATIFSPKGPLLLVLPIGMLTGTIVWAITTRRFVFWKLDVLWRTFAQVMLCFIIVLIGTYFSGKAMPGNWNLLSLSSGHPLTRATGNMFDLRALNEDSERLSVLNARVEYDYEVDWRKFASSDAVYQSSEMFPLRAKLALMGKLTFMGLFLPDAEITPGNKLRKDYRIRSNYESTDEARGVQDSIADIMRKTARPVFVHERRSNTRVAAYNQTVVRIYRWFYPILFFLGLAGWLAGLVDRKYLAALFLLPFMLNILLQVYSMNLASELVQSMDVLLLIGALAGLHGLNAKALQKPKDEYDRRTIKPIRPTRLLTRQEKRPFVHHGN